MLKVDLTIDINWLSLFLYRNIDSYINVTLYC